MTIVSEFSDEGFSGKNIKGRPEFTRMMEKIESGEDGVDFVLVFKLSRFGRNAADVLNSLQIPGFSSGFVKSVLDNPVYMGKIAYGRRRTEKKIGTRNEMHIVEQDEYPIYDGHHEAIISEADWRLAQEKCKANNFKREKVHDIKHAHILSGLLKCPCCGKSLYGNIAKAHSKDKYTRYYYYCKNTLGATGHKCSFRLNIEQTEMNRMVAAIISAMVKDKRFKDAIKEAVFV